MVNYKLDVSFDTKRGMVRLHVFDLDDSDAGPLQSCEIGEDLESGKLRRAWRELVGPRPSNLRGALAKSEEERTATESLLEERDKD